MYLENQNKIQFGMKCLSFVTTRQKQENIKYNFD